MKSNNQVARRSMIQEMIYSIVMGRLEKMDVRVDGKRPGDFNVHSENFYLRLFKFSIGIDRLAMGESYMDGEFSCEDLVELVGKVLFTKEAYNRKSNFISNVLHSLPLLWFDMQSRLNSKKDISTHYDIGNDLFRQMLDRAMNYSCGYWQKNVALLPSDSNNNSELELKKNTLCETLDEAQMNKMLLIGRKLHLKPGMTVLDIGCGWGYLAKFLAINFGVNVIAITISKEQYEWANSVDTELEQLDFLRILDSKNIGTVEFRMQDYRDVEEKFDRIVSVGMFEHVGSKNYSMFFDVTRNCLKDDGLFLLHTIGLFHHKIPQVDPWTNKYIFPGGMLPYHTQIINAFYGKFVMEDFHNLSYCYYRTLTVWKDRFLKSWPQLQDRYDERFKRMWIYYLSMSAVIFKHRIGNLFQFVLSRRGMKGGYVSYR